MTNHPTLTNEELRARRLRNQERAEALFWKRRREAQAAADALNIPARLRAYNARLRQHLALANLD